MCSLRGNFFQIKKYLTGINFGDLDRISRLHWRRTEIVKLNVVFSSQIVLQADSNIRLLRILMEIITDIMPEKLQRLFERNARYGDTLLHAAERGL